MCLGHVISHGRDTYGATQMDCDLTATSAMARTRLAAPSATRPDGSGLDCYLV